MFNKNINAEMLEPVMALVWSFAQERFVNWLLRNSRRMKRFKEKISQWFDDICRIFMYII